MPKGSMLPIIVSAQHIAAWVWWLRGGGAGPGGVPVSLLWLLAPQEQCGGRAGGDDSGEYGCEVGEQYRAERDRGNV